jgi:hypothetical protein
LFEHSKFRIYNQRVVLSGLLGILSWFGKSRYRFSMKM